MGHLLPLLAVEESGLAVTVQLKLGIGKCNLSLQVPSEHADKPLSAYVGARIVTSFPEITRKYFAPLDAAANAAGQPVKTTIKYVSGSVESAVGLGLADAVVDLVETGTTMRAAGLCEFKKILASEAVLISNPQNRHPELVKRLVDRIQGYIDATKYEMVSYNAPRAALPRCLKITPGKRSPSVMPLEDGEWVAVQALVAKKQVPNAMDELTAVGATDILVFSMTNCRC